MKAYKLGLLAASITAALAMPVASNATVVSLGVIGVPGGVGIAGSTASAGSFTDYFNFKVSSLAGVGAQAISWSFSGNGVALNKISLYSGLNGTGSSLASSVASASGSGLTFFAANVAKVGFVPGTDYSVKVEATGLGVGGMYNGSIVTAPVPEPEEWAMMLVGVGLVGYQVRRKQNRLGQSTLG